MGFKFNLGDLVHINVSNEVGEVIGRADYLDSNNQYQIRYQAGDGRAVEAWWTESAISLFASDEII